jgi:hypothetical protein
VKNAYLILPIKEGDHPEWVQVGRGRVTDPFWCGRHKWFLICRDKASHEGVVLNDVLYSGKDCLTHEHLWCKSKDCPRCFLDGWAGRTSRHIWGKLSAGIARGYGEIDHYTVSTPRSMWGLPEADLRKMATDGCLRRGIDGCLVSHARRINRKEHCLEFALHYHGLGFSNYRCRDCASLVVGKSRSWCSKSEFCDGFEQKTRREYERDGLIVKVMGKRASGLTVEESVIKTLRYILSHASYIRSFRKRFYIVSYFGRCSNRNLKSLPVKAVRKCPVCASVGVTNEMTRCSHWSDEFIAVDIGDPDYLKCFPSEEFDKSGLPKFVDIGGGGLPV